MPFSCCCLPSSDSPQRFVAGTLLLLLGSAGLLAAQQLYDRENADESNNDQATATTAVMLCGIVLAFSLLALIFHILSIRTVKKQQQGKEEATASTANDGDNNTKKSFLDWFLYPEKETVAEEKRAKQTRHHETVFRQLAWSRRSRVLLLAPSVALFLLLVVRLFLGADNFEAIPYYLDYGWKYGLLPHDQTVESDGDELYNKPAEKSIAFIVEPNSYGHALQGFFSAILAFPVVAGALNCGCNNKIWKNLVALAPFALTIYPTYNIIKRVSKAASAFAGSSFANNSFEWAAGFVVACAVGNFVTSVVLRRRLSNKAKEQEENDNERQLSEQEASSPPWWNVWVADKKDSDDDKEESNKNKNKNNKNKNNQNNDKTDEKQEEEDISICVKILQILLGFLLVITVFAAAVLFGLTWHGCLDGSPDECVNYSEDGEYANAGIFAGFCLIPTVVIVGALCMECRRSQERQDKASCL